MKVAVVGIGGTGSAAARFLAAAGHQVTGYEQFGLGHTQGSSHGESRIIRYTYPDLLYTQMMGDAYPLWAALEEEAGEELFVPCGGLYAGPEDNPSVRATEDALLGAGLPYEKLGPGAVRDRFPAFHLHGSEIALYQADSGFLRAGRCVLANARLARKQGALIRDETAVEEIESRGHHVVVRTRAGDEEAFDRVVVTAGAWLGRLFAHLGLPLRVTRQQVVYLRISHNADYFEPGRLPVWIDAGENFYGFPSDGQIPGAKLAAHDLGPRQDPDAERPPVSPQYIEQVLAFSHRRLPDLAGPPTYAHTCLYTNTPDEHFIIDRVPGMPGVWLVSGCSGHGFKFTALLGKIAADLATDGAYSRDLSRFSLARFRA